MTLKDQKYAQTAATVRGLPDYETAVAEAGRHKKAERVRIRARSSGKFDVLVMTRLPEAKP